MRKAFTDDEVYAMCEEKQKNLDSDRLYFAAGSSERKALERWEDENLAGPLFPCPFLGAVREELQLQKL